MIAKVTQSIRAKFALAFGVLMVLSIATGAFSIWKLNEVSAIGTKLEKEIADLEAQERDYAAELEKPETYHSGGRATQINRELMHVSDRLAEATAQWEQAGTELAAVEATAQAE